jgi:hypothetical protein
MSPVQLSADGTIRTSHNEQHAALEEFFSGNDLVRIASTLKAVEKLLKI